MSKAAFLHYCVIFLQIHTVQHSLLYAKKCLTLNVLQSFDMNIVERPARYVQRVVTDLSDNHVMYQTPCCGQGSDTSRGCPTDHVTDI